MERVPSELLPQPGAVTLSVTRDEDGREVPQLARQQETSAVSSGCCTAVAQGAWHALLVFSEQVLPPLNPVLLRPGQLISYGIL